MAIGDGKRKAGSLQQMRGALHIDQRRNPRGSLASRLQFGLRQSGAPKRRIALPKQYPDKHPIRGQSQPNLREQPRQVIDKTKIGQHCHQR